MCFGNYFRGEGLEPPRTLLPYRIFRPRTKIGGSGRIRTSGAISGTAVFETARFSHSRTLPYVDVLRFELRTPTV